MVVAQFQVDHPMVELVFRIIKVLSMTNINSNHCTLSLTLLRLFRFFRLPWLPLSFSTRWHWYLFLLLSFLFFLRCITWFFASVRITYSKLLYFKTSNNREQTRPQSLIGDLDEYDGEAHTVVMQSDDVSVVVLQLKVNQ